MDYDNLIELVDVLNEVSMTDEQIFNSHYADRSQYEDATQPHAHHTVNERDLNTLLDVLIGNPSMEWVGNNCTYTEAPCIKDGQGLLKRTINIDTGVGPYSKCFYGNDHDDENIITRTDYIKNYNCGDLEACGSNVGYYWNVDPVTSVNQIADSLEAVSSPLTPIAKKGRCEKRYLDTVGASENLTIPGNSRTNDSTDQYIGTNAIGSDGKYNCKPFGTLLSNTEYGARFDETSPAGGIARECNDNPIWSRSVNWEQEGQSGEALPGGDWTNHSSYTKTTDCQINNVDVSYKLKGNPKQDCGATHRYYPGDSGAANLHPPIGAVSLGSSAHTPEQWWNENSCVFKYDVNFNPTIGPENNNKLSTFNGRCNMPGSNTSIDINNIFQAEYDKIQSSGRHDADINNTLAVVDSVVDNIDTECAWVGSDSPPIGPGDDEIDGDPVNEISENHIGGKFMMYRKKSGPNNNLSPHHVDSDSENSSIILTTKYRPIKFTDNPNDCDNISQESLILDANKTSTNWYTGSGLQNIKNGTDINNDVYIKGSAWEIASSDGRGSGELWRPAEISQHPKYNTVADYNTFYNTLNDDTSNNSPTKHFITSFDSNEQINILNEMNNNEEADSFYYKGVPSDDCAGGGTELCNIQDSQINLSYAWIK